MYGRLLLPLLLLAAVVLTLPPPARGQKRRGNGPNGYNKNNAYNKGVKGGPPKNYKPVGGGKRTLPPTLPPTLVLTTTTTTSLGPKPCVPDPKQAKQQLEAGLNTIIGLDEVKRDVRKRVSIAQVNAYAKRYANPSASPGKLRQGFAFLGPPGTGKTSVAQLVGSAFCSLGMVKHDGFLELRPDDLIGTHLGESGHKTRKKLEPALGGVIFIDEAYMLTSQDGRGPSQYQQEVVGALMDLMDRRASDTVFIFAGYDCEMEDMFKVNEGLKRRVPDIFRFMALSVESLVQVLRVKLESAGMCIMPDYSDESMAKIAAEFASLAHDYDADSRLWDHLGGRPKELDDPEVEADSIEMPKKFSEFVRLRVGALHSPGEPFLEKVTDGESSFEASQDLKENYAAFIAAEIQPLMGKLPKEQRQKSNGGVIDQVLDRMYQHRNSRIMEAESVSHGKCKALALLDEAGAALMKKLCPVLLVYTVEDMASAVEQAALAWGGGEPEEEGAGEGEGESSL